MESSHTKISGQPKSQPKEAGVDAERRQAALKDGEGRTAADLDQLAQVGELVTGGQPDERAESDPSAKTPASAEEARRTIRK